MICIHEKANNTRPSEISVGIEKLRAIIGQSSSPTVMRIIFEGWFVLSVLPRFSLIS